MKPITSKVGVTICSFWPVILAYACLPLVLFYAGCPIADLIAVISTPTSAEQVEGSAEYDLSKNKDQKILIFVDQPTYLSAYPNLRFYLTDMITKTLQSKDKARISRRYLSIINRLPICEPTPPIFIRFRRRRSRANSAPIWSWWLPSPTAMFAIYPKGLMSPALLMRTRLFIMSHQAKSSGRLTEQSKLVGVGFESERRGRDAAIVRLAAAASHCVTRYLYNCPKAGFKISDERTASGW